MNHDKHPAHSSSGVLVVCRALCLGYAGPCLDELGGPDQLGGDGPGLGGREGSPLLSRPHRVPEVEGETVVVLGDVDPERRARLRLSRAESRAVVGVDVRSCTRPDASRRSRLPSAALMSRSAVASAVMALAI